MTPSGSSPFPSGPYVFIVEKRPSELAVWLRGHPEEAALVPADPEHTTLAVRPQRWNEDLPVTYGGKGNNTTVEPISCH